MRVGILGLQGCIEPHERMLHALGVDTLRVRLPEDLASIDRIILPGGESTTMLSLMLRANLFEPLQFFGKTKPMWGICAGSILMAREVEHPKQQSLELLSIKATRNYYGSQKESFKAHLAVAAEVASGAPLEVDFIRAPLLTSLSEGVRVLAYLEKQPVLFQQGHFLASSFHTELGTDSRLHQHFLGLAAERETLGTINVSSSCSRAA